MAHYRTTTILVTALLVSTVMMAEMLHSPVRIRVNSELLKGIFHKKDQELLQLFDNLNLGDHDLTSSTKIKDFTVTFEPKSGNKDEFDYNLSLDMKTFLGIESQDMKFSGKGQILHEGKEEGEDFTIEGPVSNFRISFEIQEDVKDIGKKMELKDFDFKLDFDQTKIQSPSNVFEEHDHATELKQWIQDRLVTEMKSWKDKIEAGDTDILQKMPVLSLAPVFGLYYATYGAEKVTFSDHFVEYDFSPLSLKLVDKLHDEFLKSIETDFGEDQEGQEPSAVQLIFDENMINGIIGQFLKIEKMYSLREFMSLDPRFSVFKQLLTTTTLGMVLPSFKEEYGDGRPLDLVGTASHDFIDQGLGGDLTPSGFQLEKNGNFHFQINLGSQLVVENKKGVWEEGRSLYVTFQIKGKMFVADPQYDNRTFVILPKGISLANLKILKGDQEQFLEQMLIQSMVGFQLDQMRKSFQPVIVPLKKFPNPKEFSCLGFNLTNVDIKVNKGYLQVNGNYVKIDKPDDEEYCKGFEESVAKSPQAIFNKIAGFPGFGKMAGMTPKEKPRKPHTELPTKGEEPLKTEL